MTGLFGFTDCFSSFVIIKWMLLIVLLTSLVYCFVGSSFIFVYSSVFNDSVIVLYCIV